MLRWRWVAGFFIVSLAVSAGWLWQSQMGLGVAEQWVITPHQWWPAGAWGLPLVVLALFGGLAALSAYDCFVRAKTPSESRQSAALSVGAICLFALLWPWFLLGPGGTANLVSASFSDVSNQYFSVAWQMDDARSFTRDYAKNQQQPKSIMLAHVATHPPGAVLFYDGARRIYQNVPFLKSTFEAFARWQTGEDLATTALSANAARRTALRVAGLSEEPADLPFAAVGGAIWSAFLLSLLMALSVPAVYWLAQMGKDEDLPLRRARGLIAAALFATAPAVGLFTFTLDALIAAGAVWTLLFLMLGLHRQKYFWHIASGALAGLLCFVSFGALAVIAIIALVLLLHSRQSWRAVLSLLVGFVGILVLLQLIFPMQLLLIFQQAMAAHRFATLESRTWHLWMWVNVIVFALFSGWALWWMSLASIGESFRHWRRKMQLNAAQQIGIASFAVLLLLTVSGGARGEVERLWFFLIAPMAVLAAQYLQKVPLRKEVYLLSALLGGQCLQTLFMAAALAPLVRPF